MPTRLLGGYPLAGDTHDCRILRTLSVTNCTAASSLSCEERLRSKMALTVFFHRLAVEIMTDVALDVLRVGDEVEAEIERAPKARSRRSCAALGEDLRMRDRL